MGVFIIDDTGELSMDFTCTLIFSCWCISWRYTQFEQYIAPQVTWSVYTSVVVCPQVMFENTNGQPFQNLIDSFNLRMRYRCTCCLRNSFWRFNLLVLLSNTGDLCNERTCGYNYDTRYIWGSRGHPIRIYFLIRISSILTDISFTPCGALMLWHWKHIPEADPTN